MCLRRGGAESGACCDNMRCPGTLGVIDCLLIKAAAPIWDSGGAMAGARVWVAGVNAVILVVITNGFPLLKRRSTLPACCVSPC